MGFNPIGFVKDLVTAPVRAVINPLGNVVGQTQILARENPEVVSALGNLAGITPRQPAPAQPPGGPVISPEQQAQIASALPQAQLSRLGAPEEQAMRARIARDLMTEQQAGQRQLLAQQAKQGVRGGAAAAQQSQLAQRIAAQRAAQEESGFMQQRMFNIGQEQKEQFTNIASEIARRQLLASMMGQEAQVRAARELGQAQLAAAQQGGGGFMSWLGFGD